MSYVNKVLSFNKLLLIPQWMELLSSYLIHLGYEMPLWSLYWSRGQGNSPELSLLHRHLEQLKACSCWHLVRPSQPGKAPEKSMTHISWLNFDTTRVLIGQEPMGYCAATLNCLFKGTKRIFWGFTGIINL